MKDIVLVSAFFDIGRENVTYNSRTKDQYFYYFDFWARINNNLIIYCNSNDKDKVFSIRAKYGLEQKTSIIVIDDIYSLEKDIFLRMCSVERDVGFSKNRYSELAIENNAKYDYVMLLKFWLLADAGKKVDSNTQLVWFDFGFNHGGELYIDSNDFDFLWEYDFSNKINIFALDHPDHNSAFENLIFQKVSIQGSPIIVPQDKAPVLWELMKEVCNALLDIGCIDSDQELLLILYKKHREMFDVHVCRFFEPIMLFSNHKFSTRNRIVMSKKRKTYIRLKKAVKALFLFHFSYFRKKLPNNKEFSKRLLSRARDFYEK